MLSDRERSLIVHMATDALGQWSAGRLRAELALDAEPTRTLGKLARAGLLQRRRVESWTIYQLTDAGHREATGHPLPEPAPSLDVTPYQLDILRAMSRSPAIRWSAETIGRLLPDGQPPPRPSLRRLVCKGLICTHSSGFGAPREYWLTREGRLAGDGRDDPALARCHTLADARVLCPSLTSTGFEMLRAMSSSAHKQWSGPELDSVMPRSLDPTSADGQSLYDLGLVKSDGRLLWLTTEGYRVATGRRDFRMQSYGAAQSREHSTAPPPSAAPSRAGCIGVLLAAGIVLCFAWLAYSCTRNALWGTP